MRPIGKAISTVLAVFLLSALTAHGETPSPLRQISLVELSVQPVPGGPEDVPRDLALKADRPGQLEFDVHWDGVGKVTVEFGARAEPSGDSGVQSLTLQAVLTLPGGRKVQASREAIVDQRGSVLFELFRKDDRPFTLMIEATVSETWEVVSRPSVGAQVRFDIDVMRVEGARRFSLERNTLNTFKGQTVRYEFRLGQELNDDALTLTLTPVRLLDDLVEIRVTLTGRLPDGDGVAVIGREETLIANRGSASSITALTGEPPTGYVFQVTPRF